MPRVQLLHAGVRPSIRESPAERGQRALYVGEIQPRILLPQGPRFDLHGRTSAVARCDRQLVHRAIRIKCALVPAQRVIVSTKAMSRGGRVHEMLGAQIGIVWTLFHQSALFRNWPSLGYTRVPAQQPAFYRRQTRVRYRRLFPPILWTTLLMPAAKPLVMPNKIWDSAGCSENGRP